jgi:hypothetical protein
MNECEEGPIEAEPEIDLDSDPFASEFMSGPDSNWEAMIKSIRPRKPEFPSADAQRASMRQLLDILDKEPEAPSAEQVKEASDWLASIKSIIPNHERFVASGFSACYPAWHELLKDSGKKSAKMVLGWIKNGFKPRFTGTYEAKPAKRKVVISMLSKIVPGAKIPELLKGKFPHWVRFKNHQSLYRKWDFSSEQIVKLLEADAAGIWDEAEPPVV